MIVARGLEQASLARKKLQASHPGTVRPVVTIGFFDGFHLGHQRVVEDLHGWSRELGGQPVVVTFDRHPQEVLRGREPFTVTSLDQRLLFLARAGVEMALVLRFQLEMALWSADEFVARVLRDALGAREFFMGFDTAIGHKRRGTFEYLTARQEALGISLRRGGIYKVEGQRISSTLVREAVQAGRVENLGALLGRPFSVLGEVVRGAGRGQKLGFPTANLALPDVPLPPRGVYFADACVLPGTVVPDTGGGGQPEEISPDRGACWPAVVNIGLRPTFNPTVNRTVKSRDRGQVFEVHLLDYEGDLYNRSLEVHLLRRHREERRFSGEEELKAQIQADIDTRRQFRFEAGE